MILQKKNQYLYVKGGHANDVEEEEEEEAEEKRIFYEEEKFGLKKFRFMLMVSRCLGNGV